MIGTLIGVGLCACMGIGIARARSSPPISMPAPASGELPYFPRAIDCALISGMQRGITDPQELTIWAAERVYPVRADNGARMHWPPSQRDGADYRRAFYRIKIRATRFLAIAADEAAGE